MLPKERFIRALRRQPTDRVPLFDFLFQRPLFGVMIGHMPESYNARDAMACTYALGLDAVWIPYGAFAGWQPPRLAENVYKDEWGTIFQSGESSWPLDAPIAYPLHDRADLAQYVPPDPILPGRLDDIQQALHINAQAGAKAVAVLGGVGGPFTQSWMLTGYENIALKVYDDPGYLKDLATINNHYALPAVRAMADAGVDAIIVSEDLGDSSREFLRREQFRDLYLPFIAEIVREITRHGLPAILHSCGHISNYLDDLVATGLSAVHPLQRTAGMDLAAVKARYGDRICIIGNIDSSRTLPYGSPEDVAAEVREALRIAMPGGGYVVASDHSLHDGIPVANILAMFETARREGVYGRAA
jgi:uroporphyrinogen decarboxylase